MDRLLVLFLLPLFGNGARVDMSYSYDESTNMWPGGKVLTYNDRTTRYPNGSRIAAQDFCIAEHSGTHMDAPFHFNENGWKVADIPFERLFGPGVRVDISEKAKKNRDALLEIEDLENWEQEHGPIPEGSILLVYSGWGQYWNDRAKYFGDGSLDTSLYHFPGVDVKAADWIRKTSKIVGVGIDSPSVDSGGSTGNKAHFSLSKSNIYNLENVANMDKVPASGAQIYVLPMKLKIGTGAPCRVVADLGSNAATGQAATFFSMLIIVIAARFI